MRTGLWLVLLGVLAMSGCAHNAVRRTAHIPAVEGFEVERYLGTWYEIARFPHYFEKGLTHVTANYTQEAKGRIRVVNRGYDPKKGKWRQARGWAKPGGDVTVGELRVSFFRPFYGAYRIIALDKDDYQYAMVTAGKMSYFWILARTPTLAQPTLDALLAKARGFGFDLRPLIIVDQTEK